MRIGTAVFIAGRSLRSRHVETLLSRETRKRMSETPADMVGWFQGAVKEYDAFCLVYYRGRW